MGDVMVLVTIANIRLGILIFGEWVGGCVHMHVCVSVYVCVSMCVYVCLSVHK